MALKYKLDSLDGLDDATKALYEASGDKFVLKVEGLQEGDLAGLKKQNQDLLSEKKEIAKQLQEVKDAQAAAAAAATAAAEEAARKSGDLAALEKSWKDKMDAAVLAEQTKHRDVTARLEKTIDKLLRQDIAHKIAAKIAVQGSDSLLVPHILQRLGVEEVDGERKTIVLDAEGKRSALTIDELEKEFVGNAAFAPVIAGSRASGGGAGGSGGGGGAAKKFSEMAESERTALYKSDPDAYRKLRDADKAVAKKAV